MAVVIMMFSPIHAMFSHYYIKYIEVTYSQNTIKYNTSSPEVSIIFRNNVNKSVGLFDIHFRW